MISKELKKLGRRELVDIIYQLKVNEQKLQEKITELEESLQEKRIRISMAGSIAEAAMDMTNIFSTAQVTADLYLREVANLKEDTEKECAKLIADAKDAATKMLMDNEKKCAEMNDRYEAEYKKWQDLRAEIEALEKKKKKR